MSRLSLTCGPRRGGEEPSWDRLPVAAAAASVVSVSMSLPGLEGGQQHPLLTLALPPPSLQVERVCDVTGNQDFYGVSPP